MSLFVQPEVGAAIEAVRRVVDPVQSRLIPAHVTLCREDELVGRHIAAIESTVVESALGPVILQFGPPERFHDHGILLPCIGGEPEFRKLREHILGPGPVRQHWPHITLAHPRNPKAPENELTNAASLAEGMVVSFASVQLIEQADNAPWVIRRTFPLVGRAV